MNQDGHAEGCVAVAGVGAGACVTGGPLGAAVSSAGLAGVPPKPGGVVVDALCWVISAWPGDQLGPTSPGCPAENDIIGSIAP